jgi:hypothetical protein
VFWIIAAFIVAFRKGVLFGSSSGYTSPILHLFTEILTEFQIMVRGPRSKHIGPWSGDSVSRFKLRGSRLLDAEPGVTGAGSGSSCFEGWGLWLRGMRLADRGPMMGWQLKRRSINLSEQLAGNALF